MNLEKAVKVIAKNLRIKQTGTKSKAKKLWEKFTEKDKPGKFVAKRYVDFVKKYGKKEPSVVTYIRRKLGLMRSKAEKNHNQKLVKLIDKTKIQIEKVAKSIGGKTNTSKNSSNNKVNNEKKYNDLMDKLLDFRYGEKTGNSEFKRLVKELPDKEFKKDAKDELESKIRLKEKYTKLFNKGLDLKKGKGLINKIDEAVKDLDLYAKIARMKGNKRLFNKLKKESRELSKLSYKIDSDLYDKYGRK